MARLVLLLILFASPALAQDVVPTLEQLRPTYPTPMSKAQLAEMLNRAAAQHPGWGMLRKDYGNNCPTPYPGVSISCDWLVFGPTRWGYDVLSDQEGAARIVRSDGEALAAGTEVVAAWGVAAPPPPPPQPAPQPAPAPVDLTPILTSLDAHAARLLDAGVVRDAALAAQLQELSALLAQHDAEPPFWVARFLKDGKTWVGLAGVLAGYFGRRATAGAK